MREKYESLSLVVLKDLAKARGLKGISTMKKGELIDRMLQEDEREKEAAPKASALTDVRRPKSVLSGVRPATCPALTVPLSLHVAKHSLCLL